MGRILGTFNGGDMNRLINVAAVLILLFSVSSLFAVTDEEIFRAFSLNLSTPGARAIGMGGAFIGLADDATAAETNPAGLSILSKPELSVEYHYADPHSISDNIVGVPIQNLDITPSPVEPGDDTPNFAEFHSKDTVDSVNEIGFFSVVYPFNNFAVAFSRHPLINAQATLSGSLSASPFHFIESNSFEGTSDIRDINYNISAAGKIGKYFSLGATLKISDFSFQSRIGARQKSEDIFGEHFVSSIDTNKTEVGFNVGVLVHPTDKISIGAVYKYEPNFDLDVVVANTDFNNDPRIAERSGLTKVGMDIPDSLGIGVSVAPNPNWHINFDYDRVFYSQLEPVETGFSLFTHLLPLADQASVINFKIDDSNDVHIGTEYLLTSHDTVYAIRGGYARTGRNRFFLGSAPNPIVSAFLQPIFGTESSDPINHLTFGTGFTHKSFQLDAAIDLQKKNEINFTSGILDKQELTDPAWDLVISGVFRF